MKVKQKTWLFKKKTQEFLISNELKSNGRIIKGSLLAIIVGFIIAGIVIAAQNVNAFEYYGKLFSIAFSGLYLSQTLQWFSVYIIAGLAVAVGFKTGVFNIGVAGQMLAGASLATVMFNLTTPKAATMSGGMIFAIFLVCVLAGALLAGIAGWLKAMFNIHEVVSTIMLNWIVWYLFKFVFMKWTSNFTSNGVATNPFPSGLLNWGSSEVAIPIIVAFVTVFIVWIIFSKTVFGFHLKAVGSSTTVSKYAGINVKNKVVAAMTISGALAGLASFLNIFTVSPNLSFGTDNLPTIGYDAIAVSLVAFNNPFGVVGVSVLWGVVQSAGGSAAALFNMPSQLSLLIFGIVVYFAAISIVFIKWAPSYKIKLRYYIWNSKLYSAKTQFYNKEILKYRWWIHEPSRSAEYKKQMATFKKQISETQTSAEVEQIKVQIKEYKFDFKENCRLNISKYETLLKNYKTQLYLEKINSGLQGIKRRARARVNEVNAHGIHRINLLTLELVKTRDFYEKAMLDLSQAKNRKVQALKIQLHKNKHALRVWKENQFGELQLDFALSSGKIAAKGEYSKQKNLLEEEIKNVRSDQRLKFHLIRFDAKLTVTQKKIERGRAQVHTKNRIAHLKGQIFDLKIKMKQQFADLKLQHQLQAWKLKEDSAPISKIKTEYEARLNKLKADYNQDLQVIENEEAVRISKFNQDKSAVDLQKGQEILQNCHAALQDQKFVKPTDLKKQLKNIHQQLLIINDHVAQLYLVFTRNHYQEYDNNQALKEKMKIFVCLAKWEHLYQVQLQIVETDLALSKVKKQNERIEAKFKTELKTIRKDYQSNKAAIKKVKNQQGSNYQKSLIDNEQVYVDKINASVDSLETQYLVQGVS